MAKHRPIQKPILKNIPNSSYENGNNDSSFQKSLRSIRGEIAAFLFLSMLWSVFIHYCYPIPDMNSDTGGYIRWALENKYGGTRPIGYSHFLSYVHSFSKSAFAVFIVQFTLFVSALLFFYVSIIHLFTVTNKYVRIGFLSAIIVFFTGYYSTNLISSDNLFLSLSLLLVTSCLWFVQRPGVLPYIAIISAMMLCITIRYIGMIYPAVMVIAFFVGIRKKWLASLATLLPCLMIVGYANKVIDNTDRDQAVPVFSAFGGWQLANNAIHVIPHIDLSKPLVQSDDPDVIMVDSIVRFSYPALKSKYPAKNEVSYQGIWIDSLPLRLALYKKRELTRWDHYHAWNHMGLVFSDYGKALITKHPYEFSRYYLYNNVKRLIKPEVEIFESFLYNSSTGKYERDWFELNKHVDKKGNIQPAHDLLRPILKKQALVYPILWMLFCFALVSFLVLLRRKTILIGSPIVSMSAILVAFVVIYGAANVYGAPVMLRFMMPVRMCIIAFVIICIQLVVAHYKQRKQYLHTTIKKTQTQISEYAK